MGILNRLNRLVRSEFNDAIGSSNERSTRSALDEMESSLREARRRQSELSRNEEELIDAIRAARERADEWEERAMMALQNDDEALAREALEVKNESVRRANRLREELEDVRSHMQDIETSLEALEMKLQSHRERLEGRSDSKEDDRSKGRGNSRKRRISSDDRSKGEHWEKRLERRRRERRDSSKENEDQPDDRSRRSSPRRQSRRPPETDDPQGSSDDGVGADRAFREFDRMAGKVDQMEAELEATRELSDELGDSRRSKLERIFRRMEEEAGVRDRKRRDTSSSGPDRRDRDDRRARDESDRSGTREGGEQERDDLSGLKRRVDRLSELKDTFSDDEDE